MALYVIGVEVETVRDRSWSRNCNYGLSLFVIFARNYIVFLKKSFFFTFISLLDQNPVMFFCHIVSDADNVHSNVIVLHTVATTEVQ